MEDKTLNTANQRRLTLLKKKYDNGLSDQEAQELSRLQQFIGTIIDNQRKPKTEARSGHLKLNQGQK